MKKAAFAAVVVALSLPVATRASPPAHFRGSACVFRSQAWALTQRLSDAVQRFENVMLDDYGGDDPYLDTSGDVQSVTVSHANPKAAAFAQTMHVQFTAKTTGLIAQTWRLAWKYGMNTPLGGKAAAPKRALRALLAADTAFDTTLVQETKGPGFGNEYLADTHRDLGDAWAALKQVPCGPPAPAPQPTHGTGFTVKAWLSKSALVFGDTETLYGKTVPGAECSGHAQNPKGYPPSTLRATHEDVGASGVVSWSWQETDHGQNGKGTASVICAYHATVAYDEVHFTVSGS